MCYFLFIRYQVAQPHKPDLQNSSIQSCPSKQQLSLWSNRWSVKSDHWTNGLCCSKLSFLTISLFSSISGQTISGFLRHQHIFLNSWVSCLEGGVIKMALTLPVSYDEWGKKPALYFIRRLHLKVCSDKAWRRNERKAEIGNFLYVVALSRGGSNHCKTCQLAKWAYSKLELQRLVE